MGHGRILAPMKRPLSLLAIPLLALSMTGAVHSQGKAPFLIVETGQGFQTIDDAVSAVRDNDATILIAPGTYRQCTVQAGGRITYRARTPGTVIFEGTACEGKAAFVLRGRGSTVDGIIFRGISVADGNGAGIRTEIGDLTVTNSMFLDSQEGILGGQSAAQKVVIDHSTFAGLGQCETYDCSHSVYLSNNGSVTITNSRFERGTGGHYVKVRTPMLTVTDSSFDDSAGTKTNYMIDMSEGGAGLIARNTFVQGAHKENWTAFITLAAEKRTFSTAGLRIEGNIASLAPGFDKSPAFVADYAHDRPIMAGNRLAAGIRDYETR